MPPEGPISLDSSHFGAGPFDGRPWRTLGTVEGAMRFEDMVLRRRTSGLPKDSLLLVSNLEAQMVLGLRFVPSW